MTMSTADDPVTAAAMTSLVVIAIGLALFTPSAIPGTTSPRDLPVLTMRGS
jgi:hypothetical protein